MIKQELSYAENWYVNYWGNHYFVSNAFVVRCNKYFICNIYNVVLDINNTCPFRGALCSRNKFKKKVNLKYETKNTATNFITIN